MGDKAWLEGRGAVDMANQQWIAWVEGSALWNSRGLPPSASADNRRVTLPFFLTEIGRSPNINIAVQLQSN